MPQGLTLAGFRAVLFDVDGTLVDSLDSVVEGLGDTYEKYSGVRPPAAEIKALIGLPLRKQLLLFRTEPPSEAELAEAVDYAIERFEVNKHLERPLAPAIEALRVCKRAGLRTALVTSKSRKELELFLQRFPAADSVDATVTASDVIRPKPAPDSALLACKLLDVDPADAAMIGDSVYDVLCAKSAGVATVAVGYGSSQRSNLLAESPDAFFETPQELCDWVTHGFLQTTCPERN